jgi:hypothetical protein
MRKFFKEFRGEIIVVILLVAGAGFLIINRTSGGSVTGSIRAFFGRITDTVITSIENGLSYLNNLSTIDLIGWGMILAALVYLYSRVRYRYRHNPKMMATVCPVCESQLKRTHRTWFDRLLGATIKPKSRRYTCVNPECGWSGLRHERYRLDQRSTDDERSSANRTIV